MQQVKEFEVYFSFQSITEDSAINGNFARQGWAHFNGCNLEEDCDLDFNIPVGKWTKPEKRVVKTEDDIEFTLKELLDRTIYYYESNVEPEELSINDDIDCYGCDPDINLTTGEEVYYCAHIKRLK